eukprot:2603156-Ditylum_brightwellii.AAC.1
MALQEMGHPQSPTIVITDNFTVEGIVSNHVKQRRTRAMDMRFYWIRGRVKQGHYLVMWKPGEDKLADYSTKHFPPPTTRKYVELIWSRKIKRSTLLHMDTRHQGPCKGVLGFQGQESLGP